MGRSRRAILGDLRERGDRIACAAARRVDDQRRHAWRIITSEPNQLPRSRGELAEQIVEHGSFEARLQIFAATAEKTRPRSQETLAERRTQRVLQPLTALRDFAHGRRIRDMHG